MARRWVVAMAAVLSAASLARPVAVRAQVPVPDSVVVPRPSSAPVADSARGAVGSDSARVGAAAAPVAGAASAVVASVAEAGAPAPGVWAWERSLEVAGNYLYGNNEQAVFSTRTSVARRNARWEMRLDGRFLVGASNRAGDRVMDRRSWLVGANVDYRGTDGWWEWFFA